MKHISNLNAGVYNSMAKRLGLTDIGPYSAHGFIGSLIHNGFAIHLHNHMNVRSFKGITLENIPPFTVAVRSIIDGEVADKLEINIWEYDDIPKAIDAVKNFIS